MRISFRNDSSHIVSFNVKKGFGLYKSALSRNVGKKKKKDYELVAFFEHSFEDQARYTVMKVPKEIMAQRAVSMLNKRMLTDEGKSVVHEIFEVDLLDV